MISVCTLAIAASGEVKQIVTTLCCYSFYLCKNSRGTVVRVQSAISRCSLNVWKIKCVFNALHIFPVIMLLDKGIEYVFCSIMSTY